MPFCAARVDNVLVHSHSIMKVTIGLVGITQNVGALGFLIAVPELGRLTEEAHTITDSPTATRKGHDDLSMAVWTRQEKPLL